MKTLIPALFCLLSISIANAAGYDGKCRVLCMRGGGTKGAYEVGALTAMVELLPPIEVMYDVVAGVSVGALNTAMISIFPKG